MINEIDWELDTKTIKRQLLFNLSNFLIKRGKDYIEQNYYFIHTFIKIFLETDLINTIKKNLTNSLNKNSKKDLKINLDNHFNIIGYKKCLSSTGMDSSILPFVIKFINSNGDIISTFKNYIELNGQSEIRRQIIIDDPEFNIQLLSNHLNYKDEPSSLNIKIYKNTSLENIKNFIDKYQENIKSYQSKDKFIIYPHAKKRKDNFEYFKTIVVNEEKIKNKINNKNTDSWDMKPDTDEDTVEKIYGEEYSNIDKSKQGANRIRVKRHRIFLNIK